MQFRTTHTQEERMSTVIRIKKKLDDLSAGAEWMEARFQPRQRIARVTVHPVLHGHHKYLRALRLAEMAAWEASLPLDMAQSFAETIARSEVALSADFQSTNE
jgi:hypothetical protein